MPVPGNWDARKDAEITAGAGSVTRGAGFARELCRLHRTYRHARAERAYSSGGCPRRSSGLATPGSQAPTPNSPVYVSGCMLSGEAPFA